MRNILDNNCFDWFDWCRSSSSSCFVFRKFNFTVNATHIDDFLMDSLQLSFIFQYMIILFVLFLIQFSIAASCLAVSQGQQQQFIVEGWQYADNNIRKQVQDSFLCCGLTPSDVSNDTAHPSCDAINVRQNAKRNVFANFIYQLIINRQCAAIQKQIQLVARARRVYQNWKTQSIMHSSCLAALEYSSVSLR